MIVVSAADENFVPHFATLLRSAWFHNRDAEFYLLDCGIAPETRVILERYSTSNAIRLTILPIDVRQYLKLPSHLSTATYARLLIADLLPEACDKAIYLDADCVVTGDLSALWAEDIEEFLVAGVNDEIGGRVEAAASGIDELPVYVNAGVLLINVKAWRETNFAENAFDLLRKRTLPWQDQSAINLVATGRVRAISETWNTMLKTIDGQRLRVAPHVIHCTGAFKPWQWYDAPLARIYLHHRQLTPFPLSQLPPSRRSKLYRLLNLLILRPKYWRRLLVSSKNEREFTVPYLQAMARQSTPSSHGC